MNTHNETSLGFIGTKVNYYFICKKNLWRFALSVEMKRGRVRVKLSERVRMES